MTRKPTPTTDQAAVRRVLAALAVSRLPSQLDRETLAAAVGLDQHPEGSVLPVSWRILADRHQAEDAAAAEAAEAQDPTLLDEVTE